MDESLIKKHNRAVNALNRLNGIEARNNIKNDWGTLTNGDVRRYARAFKQVKRRNRSYERAGGGTEEFCM